MNNVIPFPRGAGQPVMTKDGPVPLSELSAHLDIEVLEGAIKFTLNWYRGDEFVRNDVWVNMLVGQSIGSEQGGLCG